MSDREKMMKKVQMYSFVLDEVGLFLDTHPEDKAALAYYKKNQELCREAKRQYEAKYGPLMAETYEGFQNKWTWVDEPWPWEYKSEV